MTAIRWALVPVACVTVWLGTLLIGIGGSSLLDALCPPDLMISGLCTAPWHRPAMAGLEMTCAAIAAFGFIALPVRIAPAFRVHVAAACFVVGAFITIELVTAGALWAPAIVAGITGVVTLSVTVAKARRTVERGQGKGARELP